MTFLVVLVVLGILASMLYNIVQMTKQKQKQQSMT